MHTHKPCRTQQQKEKERHGCGHAVKCNWSLYEYCIIMNFVLVCCAPIAHVIRVWDVVSHLSRIFWQFHVLFTSVHLSVLAQPLQHRWLIEAAISWWYCRLSVCKEILWPYPNADIKTVCLKMSDRTLLENVNDGFSKRMLINKPRRGTDCAYVLHDILYQKDFFFTLKNFIIDTGEKGDFKGI